MVFIFIRGFSVVRVFVVIIFVGRFDGSVIIASVGFDRVRTLHLAFISFSLLLPV